MTAYVAMIIRREEVLLECWNIDEAAREAKRRAEDYRGSLVEVRRADLPTATKPMLQDPARFAA